MEAIIIHLVYNEIRPKISTISERRVYELAFVTFLNEVIT